jgi:hypothetical protein
LNYQASPLYNENTKSHLQSKPGNLKNSQA